MASPILWQSLDRRITLIDVPTSIAAAQGMPTSPPPFLLSTLPLQAPFPSNEPKSAAAKAKLEGSTIDALLHAEYIDVLRQTLDDIRRCYKGHWCLPRPFVEDVTSSKKRPLDGDSGAGLPKSTFNREDGNYFINKSDDLTMYRITTNGNTGNLHYRVPPDASFYLGDCTNSKAFHDAVRDQARQIASRRSFDFIILDPPWPNRSVKRTHKTAGSTYATSPSLWDIRELLLDMKLDLVMADECLVAIWITNKPAIRELILGEDGIFACWGVELVAEWLWLKTTMYGEPVTSLDAQWRKPYEVLLLGRKRPDVIASTLLDSASKEVNRRVIISVPDLHSRKPCLKALIEPLMEDSKTYRALEIFARHLVAGWWSWGDECVKFNWEGFWRAEAEAK